MQVNVKQGRAFFRLANYVRVPDFVEECSLFHVLNILPMFPAALLSAGW